MSVFGKVGSVLQNGIKIPVVVIVLFVITIVTVGLIAFTRPQVLGLKSKDTETPKQDTQTIITEVSKVILLPDGETPTVGEVTDLSKVQNQAFFEKAAVGDRFLVYTQAKKAFLYRPSEKRIIEVGVVNFNENTTPTPTAIPTQIPIIDVSQEYEDLTPTPTSSKTKVLITPTENL